MGVAAAVSVCSLLMQFVIYCNCVYHATGYNPPGKRDLYLDQAQLVCSSVGLWICLFF